MLSRATADVLADVGVNQMTLLGGPNAVSPAVEQNLERRGYVVGRVAGRDRFHIAAEVARAVYAKPGRQLPRRPPGASAPASAGPAQVPIVLVDKDRLPEATAQVLGDRNVNLAILVGGSWAISESVRRAIEDRGVTTERIDGRTRTDTPTHGARAVLPVFRAQGGGVLVLIASLYSKVTSPYLSP